MIKVLSTFLATYGEDSNFSRDRLLNVLKDNSPKRVSYHLRDLYNATNPLLPLSIRI